MKPYILTAILALCLAPSGWAQQKLRNLLEQSKVYNVPALQPEDTYVIPLQYLGLKNSGYSLLVKARLPDDLTYYTLPGVLPTGDSFGCRLKIGNRQSGDTLFLTYRGGRSVVRLEEVLVFSYHTKHRIAPGRPQKDFTRQVVNSYYDAHTLRSNRTRAERALPAADTRHERVVWQRVLSTGRAPQ